MKYDFDIIIPRRATTAIVPAARDEFLQMGYSRRGECIAYVGGGYGFPYSTSYC